MTIRNVSVLFITGILLIATLGCGNKNELVQVKEELAQVKAELNQAREQFSQTQEQPAQTQEKSTQAKEQPTPTSIPDKQESQKYKGAIVTKKDGVTFEVSSFNLVVGFVDYQPINVGDVLILTNGRKIDFDKIDHFEITDDEVKITLLGGRIIDGKSNLGGKYDCKAELGYLGVAVRDIKKVELKR